MISDVHGNAFALEAVLADIRRSAPDLILNLGDQMEGFADPARAVQLQAALGAVEVRGNNEEKLWPGGRRTELSRQLGAWLETQVPLPERQRLAGLPLTARAAGIFACHGTPQSAWDSLLWGWNAAAGCYLSRDPRELRALVEALGQGPGGAGVVVCGHTHRPGATRVGDVLVVNAGSVSDQTDGDPRARWTLLQSRDGHWSADFRTVDYDLAGAVAWARQHSPFGDFAAQALTSGEMTGRGAG